MLVLIVDGHGGKLGTELIKAIKERFLDIEIIAIGTNAIATSAMLKAKPDIVATGENPVIVACKDVDVIIGPVGIVIADALYGELTPKMAMAIGNAKAKRILIPINKCDNLIAGINDVNTKALIEDALDKLASLIDS